MTIQPHASLASAPVHPRHEPAAPARSLLATILDDLRARGFSPGVAMVWLHEMELFGHEQWVSEGRAGQPQVGIAMEAHARLRSSLLAVRGDEGMRAWFAAFPEHFCGRRYAASSRAGPTSGEALRKAWGTAPGYETEVMESFESLAQASKSVCQALEFLMPGSHQELSDRLSGTGPLDLATPMNQPAAMEVGWSDVACAVRKRCPPWVVLDAPSFPASQQQREALATACLRAGLGVLQWPAMGGRDAATLAAMTQGLDCLVREIEAVAAANQEDGLFGLRGRLRLALDALPPQARPASGHDASGGVYIVTPAGVGWGVVAHEWLHALDAACGHESGKSLGWASDPEEPDACRAGPARIADKSAPGGAIRPWRALLAAMQAPSGLDKEAFAVMLAEARTSLVARWDKTYGRDLSAGDLPVLVEVGRAQGSAALGRAAKRAFRLHGVEAGRSSAQAALMQTEWRLLDTQIWQPGETLWRRFCAQATQALDREKPRGGYFGAGYLDAPAEILAHAFESHVGQQCASSIASDVRPQHESLRYPRPREVAQQDAAWAQFFKDLLPQLRQWPRRDLPRSHPRPRPKA